MGFRARPKGDGCLEQRDDDGMKRGYSARSAHVSWESGRDWQGLWQFQPPSQRSPARLAGQGRGFATAQCSQAEMQSRAADTKLGHHK